MPTVGLSSQVSYAVYFAAIMSLFLLLAPPVYHVYATSQERSAEVVALSLSSTIDSMTAGTSVLARLESYPAVALSVSLSGRTVTASFGGSRAETQVKWELERCVLYPGPLYNFTLEGGKVLVAPARDD